MRQNFVTRGSMLGLIIFGTLFSCHPALAQYGRGYDQYSKGGTTTQADDTYGKGGTKEETTYTAKTGTTVPKEDLTFKQTIWKDKDGRVRHASDGRVDIVFAYDNCGRRTSVTVFETAGGKRTQIQRVEKKYDKSCDDQTGHLVENEKPDEVDFANLYDLLDNFGLDWFPRWVNLNAGVSPKKEGAATPPNNENRSLPATENARVESSNGLLRINFPLPQGRVIVNLPNDMMAGDTISGTVFEEANHKSAADDDALFMRQLYIDVLKREPSRPEFWLSTVGQKGSPAPPQKFTIQIPQNQPIPIILRDKDGKELGSVTLEPITGPIWFIRDEPATTGLQSPALPNNFWLRPLGQQGRPLEIFGPFDGNSANTTVMFGPARSTVQDFEKNTENVSGGFGLIRPLAESPRKVVCESPPNVTGSVEVMVKEGTAATTGQYRSVGVNLRAPKTNLLKGERTVLTVEVTGLQGINKPVPLTLESHGVITMEGGMFQPLLIQPSQVEADGRYTTTRGITGVQAGGWGSTATVVTQPFNIILRDPDPPQTVLINSFTGDYVFCGSNLKLRGTGELKGNGNEFTLTDNKPDRQVQGRFDASKHLDFPITTVRFLGTPTSIQVTFPNAQSPKTKVYFNPRGRLTPPVQDVSAFATCP